jgi:hypothetical protein
MGLIDKTKYDLVIYSGVDTQVVKTNIGSTESYLCIYSVASTNKQQYVPLNSYVHAYRKIKNSMSGH